jgi:lipopolysaccharide/colanic/teichoic acid biosynthesis glycosyltransferase
VGRVAAPDVATAGKEVLDPIRPPFAAPAPLARAPMGLKPIVAMPAQAAYRPGGWGNRSLAQSIFVSNRWVLGLALLFAIVVPEAIHPLVKHWGVWFDVREGFPETGMIGALAALVFAHVSLQRLGILPLMSARSLILPTFLLAFGLMTLGLYAIRVDTGRYHVWTAALIGLAWYFVVALGRSRFVRPKIGFVGEAVDLHGLFDDNITWETLSGTHVPEGVSAVVVDPHAQLTVEWSRFLTDLVLQGVPVYHRAHFEEGLSGRVRFDSDADNNFGALLPSLIYRRIKVAIDVVAAVALLPLLLPLLALLALAIKLESPGPALFVQRRIGFRGRAFPCFKLRTMRKNAEGPLFTLENDARITPLGRLLRKWRLDELPQVFNILRGEMSWIGPRPEAAGLAHRYAAHVPFYDYRHAVLPGITGWAAVHQGNVAEVDAATVKLEYDFYYIKYFSVWLDFIIVLKTLQTIASGFGSR